MYVELFLCCFQIPSQHKTWQWKSTDVLPIEHVRDFRRSHLFVARWFHHLWRSTCPGWLESSGEVMERPISKVLGMSWYGVVYTYIIYIYTIIYKYIHMYMYTFILRYIDMKLYSTYIPVLEYIPCTVDILWWSWIGFWPLQQCVNLLFGVLCGWVACSGGSYRCQCLLMNLFHIQHVYPCVNKQPNLIYLYLTLPNFLMWITSIARCFIPHAEV